MTTQADLDHVLGLLREDNTTTPQPTLADLDRLLADTRAAGMTLDARVTGDLDDVPRVVSREAYVGNVLAKLQARDRTQMVIAAYESGFVSPG